MYIIGHREVQAVRRVIKSAKLFRYLERESETATFEREWAEKLGIKYALAVNNGTSALICALAGIGAGPGDEIIVPGYTFMASAAAVLAVGAIPVIAEVDDSLTIDPEDVKKKISKRTKVIMPVHICGFPANLDAITKLAQEKDICVIEDACQADGGHYKGKRLGTLGVAGAFSFNHYKIVTSGEGGAVVTNDQGVYERALIEHDSGLTFREHALELSVPIFIGHNFRANEILSAILCVQLQRMDFMIERMRKEKRFLREKLAGHQVVRPSRSNDFEGDCGTTNSFLFETIELAAGFEENLIRLGIECSRPINSDKHVYSNWDPILEHRASHHEKMNPFNFNENRECAMEYSKDMCPNTLDYLSRTVFIPNHPKDRQKDYEKKLKCIEKAAQKL